MSGCYKFKTDADLPETFSNKLTQLNYSLENTTGQKTAMKVPRILQRLQNCREEASRIAKLVSSLQLGSIAKAEIEEIYQSSLGLTGDLDYLIELEGGTFEGVNNRG